MGAALLVVILALLVREATRGPGRAPDIVATVDTVIAGQGGWLVKVSARNLGDDSAADATFRATLVRSGAAPVEREARTDYLPGHSERTLSFVFPVDPRTGKLTIEVLAHGTP